MSDEMLVWVDIETTGLNLQRDLILEVAASVAKLSDPFNATPIYHAVSAYRLNDPYGRINPKVIEMHSKNGLWDECKASETSIYDTVYGLRRALPATCILAGSSVHFDRDFLVTADPTLRECFSHRLYDVSAIKLFCRSLGMPPIAKGEAHRARADVLESIAHAQQCAEWITQLRAGAVG